MLSLVLALCEAVSHALSKTYSLSEDLYDVLNEVLVCAN